MKKKIKSKDGRLKEQGVNNNSLYDSFVENSTKKERRAAGKVKEERSRSLKRDGFGSLKKSLGVRSRNMGSPSRSPSHSRSPGGGHSDDRFKELLEYELIDHIHDLQCADLVLGSLQPSQRVALQIQALSDTLARVGAGTNHLIYFSDFFLL